MDSQYLQRLRFQLQKRFRRLNSCSYLLFHSSMLQFWNYVQAQPLTGGVLAKLDAEALPYTAEVDALITRSEIEEFDVEHKQLGFVFRTIQHCAMQPLDGQLGPEIVIGHALSNEHKHDEALNAFREFFLEPFYEFLDDALDQQAAVLSLLIKYKRKVEWFERDALVAMAAGDERSLAKHLYAYLFDQGLDFHIEPQSVSGEADLIASELVLDAKVFDGGRRGLQYLANGVHQVHTYARDFNQEVGYLVVYKTCPENIDFAFASENPLVPFVNSGGKIIYILVVDICDHRESASKRGALKVYSVEKDFLIRAAVQELDSVGAKVSPVSDDLLA